MVPGPGVECSYCVGLLTRRLFFDFATARPGAVDLSDCPIVHRLLLPLKTQSPRVCCQNLRLLLL